MRHAAWTGRIAALALCLFVVPALASPKNPVERPFKIQIQETVVLSLVDFTWESQVSGQATHLGLFSGSGSGSCNPETDVIAGEVTFIAANGDQLSWQFEATGSGGPSTSTIIAGTGRFTHATGFYVSHNLSQVETWDFEAMTLTITYTCAGEGRITY